VAGLQGKWALINTYVPADDATIPLGGSAWYLAKGAEFTLTIARPYTL